MEERGFFGALFDFSFRYFVTLRIIQFLYLLALAGGAIGAFLLGIWGFAYTRESVALGILGGICSLFILAPLLFLLYAIWVRVNLELIIALLRVAENTSQLVELSKSQSPSSPPSPTHI